MPLNDVQTRFISELQTMLSLYQSSSDPRLKTPSTNLEWNVKKLSGQGGETIDGPTFAQRTQADLELIAAALAVGAAGQAFAARGAATVGGLFGAAPAPATAAASSEPAAPAPAAGNAGASPAATITPAATDSPTPVDSPTAAPTETTSAPIDVKAMLSEKADAAGEKLAWKTSVVDLLKLLGKDASQAARHRYAVALGFPEDQIAQMPSSEFNTWLHGQLMSDLAHNGGTLSANIA